MPISANVRALGEFAASRHGTFNVSQAASNDISKSVIARMLRDGAIVRVRGGVYRFAGMPDDWKAETYGASLGLRVMASHFSGAALHGLDGMLLPPKIPELLCHHSDPVEVSGALVRRSRSVPNADVTEVDRIPCTTMARTIIDLAPLVTPDQLIRMIDDVQRRGSSMSWLLERATKLQRTGRSGPTQVVGIARRRLDGYVVPESWFERTLGRCLRSPLLEAIVRQHELWTEVGVFVARFDLAVPWARLGIEGHSRSFHLGEAAERYDEDRDIRSAQHGWEIAYLGFAATKSPAVVCHDIELIVQRRMHDLGLICPSAATRD